jgi:hypothetical protein
LWRTVGKAASLRPVLVGSVICASLGTGLLFTHLTARAATCDTSWIVGNGNGDWSNASSGSAQFDIMSRTTLSGNVSAGDTLNIVAYLSGGATLTVASSITNAGTIALTDGNCACNFTAELSISSGTLTNTGTIDSASGCNTCVHVIAGNVDNQGALTVEKSLMFDPGVLDEHKTISVGSGATLTNTDGTSGSRPVRVCVDGPEPATPAPWLAETVFQDATAIYPHEMGVVWYSDLRG